MTESVKTPKRSANKIRGAIYTRKSTDEGLEQAFNSLDAQREACAAYIQSQKHEGWVVLPALYDDGGYSGGNLERPGLKRLLADIEAEQIDVVVVYKVDRLTRALSDFAKLVEVFDRRGVSFVSITQHFNTTTSMGRLTLNVLLSFAQFEREVIGERVRDKIAASKKKGMWMGGMPPLGYDVKDRKLIVNKGEAHTVAEIYQRYLALKSVHALTDDLAAAGIRSKRRVHPDGTTYGGQTLSRGALYLILQNRLYRGEITHKGNSYPGDHPAIVEQRLWDQAQAVLATNRVERTIGARTKHPSLLAGLVFDDRDNRLTPTHATKKGTRYRYYISTHLVTGAKANRSNGMRLPAADLEGAVTGRLREFLADPAALLDVVGEELHGTIGRSELVERSRQMADRLQTEAQTVVKTLLMAMHCCVKIMSDRVEVGISRRGLIALLAGQASDMRVQQHSKAKHHADDVVTLAVPARLKRLGREMKMLVNNADDQMAPDASLLRVIARAHDVRSRLLHNTELTVHDIAREEKVSAAYIYTLLRLPWLAPDITTAIVNGRQPQQLNAMTLMRRASRLPADWTEQRTLLGFR
ncbi:MAG: recombinase family protein [Xanthobacteraceae bacterium]